MRNQHHKENKYRTHLYFLLTTEAAENPGLSISFFCLYPQRSWCSMSLKSYLESSVAFSRKRMPTNRHSSPDPDLSTLRAVRSKLRYSAKTSNWSPDRLTMHLFGAIPNQTALDQFLDQIRIVAEYMQKPSLINVTCRTQTASLMYNTQIRRG